MKRLLVACTFLLFTLFSFSQNSNFSNTEGVKIDTSNVIGGYRFNLYTNPLNKLQSLLETNDFAKLEENGYSFEVYMKTFRPKSSWDGNIILGYHQRLTSNKNATNQASMVGYTFNTERGYNLTKGKVVTVRPFFGVGIEYYKLSFVENFQGSSLANITNSDFKNYNATSFQVPWTLGIELGTTFRIKNAVIEVLLRGGYKLHLDTDKWKIDDVLDISDKINLSSPFVGLSMGFSPFTINR